MVTVNKLCSGRNEVCGGQDRSTFSKTDFSDVGDERIFRADSAERGDATVVVTGHGDKFDTALFTIIVFEFKRVGRMLCKMTDFKNTFNRLEGGGELCQTGCAQEMFVLFLKLCLEVEDAFWKIG